ncbi:MAG TPA: hypothetical protein ENO19_02540, partial [Halothiobacillaceae bacterium]|nr:hypothetical protein [Halothiobacillaceae bacterium]
MNAPASGWPLEPAALTWNDDETPRSEAFGDVCFASAGGFGENEHVFLDGNDLHARFAAGAGTR